MWNSTAEVSFFLKNRDENSTCFFAELQSLERAHGETLAHMREEVEVLRKTRRSEAELREEAHQDTLWHEGANIWNTGRSKYLEYGTARKPVYRQQAHATNSRTTRSS